MMPNTSFAISIRAKILGVLLRDARLTARRSVHECAEAIGVPTQEFEAFELGDRAISLPKLEILSYYLAVPLVHFWGNKALSEENSNGAKFNVEQLVGLRQRMIGALARQAREEAGLSLEGVATKVGIPPESLEAYEMGEEEFPVPYLEAVGEIVGKRIEDFWDLHGPIGAWDQQQHTVQEFLTLTPELRGFVSKPINRPYLELAQRMSEMSVEKLRALGEGILEITL
jgi:transcriptional regulator with XRE-family HTH domain